MKILVTGVAGFMASHLSEYLANQGHEVVGVDNLSIGSRDNVPKNITFVQADMRHPESMEILCRTHEPELVYHLACWAHEGLSQFMPRHITENNYNAFLNLIVPAINHGMKRIVVCSSMSVYGAQQTPFNEDMRRMPEDIYAIAKTAMEEATEVLADVHGFDYTIIRPHNVYGPRQILWDPYRNVAGIFINRILNGKPPIIYGDGNQKRAFSYIDDVTPYIAKAGFLDSCKGEIINIGPTEEFTVNELAHVCLQAFGPSIQLEPQHVPDRPREVKDAFCTNDKAKQLLGYKTTVSFEEGIKRMVEWAKTQGPKEFKYLSQLELTGKKIPETWSKRIM